MYYLMVLGTALACLSILVTVIVWLGGGFKTDIKGGPLIRERARKGIVRIPIAGTTSEIDEWGDAWRTISR